MLTRSIGANAVGAYGLLFLSFVAAVFAGYGGMNTPSVVAFCSSTAGWVFMLAAINVTPYIAKWAAEQDSVLGFCALAFDGVVSGLALTPLLHLAAVKAPGAITMALLITASLFVAISLAVIASPPGRFSIPTGALMGIGMTLLVGILLNGLLLHLAALHLIVCIGIGIYGTLVLAFATDEIIEKRADPVEGSLLLFAAVFNIFVAVLNVLVSRSSSKED